MSKVRSIHEPRVRYGLCRHIRSKGMLINIGEAPENDSSQRGFLAVDKNTMEWDGTTWWCTESGKTVERRSLRRGPLAVRTTLSQASAHDTVSRRNDEMELTSPCDTNGRDAYPVGAAVAVNVSTKDVRRSSRVRRHAG